MSKLLKIVLPLALLVFVLAPGVTGFLVESKIEEMEGGYEQVIQKGPFRLVGSDFQRGWFSSEQTVQIDVTDPDILGLLHTLGGKTGVTDLPSLVIETTANHGVIPLASPAKGGLKPAVAQLESTLILQYPDNSRIVLPAKVYSSLGTSQWARLIAEPMQIEDLEEGATINWGGADVSASFGKTSTYEGVIEQTVIETPEVTMELSPVQIKGNMRQTQYDFDESDSVITTERLKLSMSGPGGDAQMVVNNVDMRGGLKLAGERAVVDSYLTTGAIETPAMTIRQIDMSSEYDLDAATLSTLISESNKLADLEDADVQDTEAFFEAMNTLMLKGGHVKMDKMNVEFDEGTMAMNVDVQLPPGSATPMEAIENGLATGTVSVPETVVEALSALSPELAGGFGMATMMGFVEQKDGAYQADVRYENGILLLNGLPVPLPF